MSGEQLQGTNEIINNNETELAMIILMLGITPVISAIGIVGNLSSILVLRKQNLRKCSNILLLGLAVSDMMYLIGFNSVPKIIYTINGKHSFPYPHYVSEVLFICFEIFLIVDYSSGYISITIPMFITIERLITVFFPLHVSRIITPKKTWIAVSFVFVFWYMNITYTMFWFELGDKYDFIANRSVSIIDRSALFSHDKDAIFVVEEAWTYLSMRIPPVFTFVGCVFIGLKIKMVSAWRRQLTCNKEKVSMYRTTKTLLAVCVMYTVTCVIISLPVIIPQYVSYLLTEKKTSNISEVIYQLINLAACVNCSCNFVIYIVLNRSFRETYKTLFVRRTKHKNTTTCDGIASPALQ